MGDLISRQAAIDRINKQRDHLEPALFEQDDIGDMAYRICAEFIGRLPSAEQRGRWEHYEHRELQYDIMGVKTWAEAYKCSNCGFIHSVIEDFGHYAYCPNCGTRMDEVSKDE